MAKKKSAQPTDQKFTQKNIDFSLVKNVNEESIAGFLQLSDTNPSAVVGSVVSRNGIKQSDILGTLPGNSQFVKGFNGDNQPIPTALDFDLFFEYYLTRNPIGAYPLPGFVVVMDKTGYLSSVSLQLKINPLMLSTITNTMTLIISEYNINSKSIVESVGVSVNSNNSNTLTTLAYTAMTWQIQKSATDTTAPLLSSGKAYLIQIYNTLQLNSRFIELFSVPADVNNFALAQYTQPTLPTVFTQMNLCPVYDLVLKNLTGVSILNGNKIGVMPSINDKGYYFSNLRPATGTLPISGGVSLKQPGTTGELVLFDPQLPASTNFDLNRSFPGAEYGFKILNVGHDFGIGLGSQISNKNYPIFKRIKGLNSAIPVVASVIMPIIGYVVAAEAVAYNSETHPDTKPTSGLFRGDYQYALQWIDKAGHAYMPDGDKNSIMQISMVGVTPASDASGIDKLNFSVYDVTLTINLPQFPLASLLDFSTLNIYRKSIAQTDPTITVPVDPYGGPAHLNVNSDGYIDSTVQLDTFKMIKSIDLTSIFITPPSDITWNGTLNQITFKDTARATGSDTFDFDYYIPNPADIEIYKGHVVAIGDTKYPNFIFPSRNFYTDFYLTDIYSVVFPEGDYYFTAIKNLNDETYIFSSHGTWRFRQTSSTSPYFQIQQVSNKLGCITTSKGIVKNERLLLVPTAEGLRWFDGYNFIPTDDNFNNIWNQIDISPKQVNIGAGVIVDHIPAFEIEGIYDQTSKNIIYLMPTKDNPNIRDIFVINAKSHKWESYTNTFGAISLFNMPFANTSGVLTSSYIYEFDRVLRQDFLNDTGQVGVNIATVCETTNIDFAEKTLFKIIRLWGLGLINLDVYFDRETIPTSSFTNILLTNSGVEFPLGWKGNYFRFKITCLDSTQFEFRAFEIIYNNQGIKKFDQIN